jgi:hypothetical protein
MMCGCVLVQRVTLFNRRVFSPAFLPAFMPPRLIGRLSVSLPAWVAVQQWFRFSLFENGSSSSDSIENGSCFQCLKMVPVRLLVKWFWFHMIENGSGSLTLKMVPLLHH